ncbi:prepilin-type N-terminal cleavage/methylation domain-containing protein [Marinobacterium arenosum]|uniref:prepilin-type N-terminal cleavage/methylation domain-containing protein n=1 Tax=Marinobacterium arenosum TaxID=2862496 RepID=UPI001C967DF1|nr:prepilin-type N-terminal cleavage/methylation domain-containing protein [Marinobacterium arenosum]MBY4675837.1 prepilin-type N-terminal cleavage/methylation domain-containing protein [Marinobacterium arenosum]
MLSDSISRQRGFSFVEMMISLTLALVVVGVALHYYVTVVSTTSGTRDQTRLVEELRAAITVMTQDIRRAGYWAALPGSDDLSANPFTSGGNDLAVSAFTDEAANSCILYSYDLDEDKTVDDGSATAGDMEQFGFRLNDGALQQRTGGNSFACTDNGGWETVTTPEIELTALTFTLNESCLNVATDTSGCPCSSGAPCQHIRRVDINLSGRLVDNTATQISLTESLRIRNDKFVAVTP